MGFEARDAGKSMQHDKELATACVAALAGYLLWGETLHGATLRADTGVRVLAVFRNAVLQVTPQIWLRTLAYAANHFC
jgi:hypothetical protein